MTYSNSIASSRQKYSTRNQNSTSFEDKTRTIGPISNTIILIVLACLLGLVYLTQVTKTNTYGYQIESLQAKQQQLEGQKQNLEVAQAQLQSVGRVQNSSVAKSMVAVAPTDTVTH